MDTPQLKQRLASYGLSPDKRLGQHFLCHGPTLAKIADAVLGARHVVEIGPGPGVVTALLAQDPTRSLTLIEKDKRLEPLLRDCFPTAHIMMEDALTADWSGFAKHTFVSNLPYNVSVPIMLRYLELTCQTTLQDPHTGAGPAIFMMQKEVAARLCARPHTKAYGRLSIMTQMYVKPRLITPVPPSAFWPMPGVHSSVLMLSPYPAYHHVPFWALERVAEAAFSHRRKMLHHNLHHLGWTLADSAHLDIDLRQRAEDLSIQDFAKLTLAYLAQHCQHTTKTSRMLTPSP